MEKKTYYVSIGYCDALVRTPGIKGRANDVVPIACTEDELEAMATAVGKGLLADSCTVSLTESDAWDAYVKPYKVLWDCM